MPESSGVVRFVVNLAASVVVLVLVVLSSAHAQSAERVPRERMTPAAAVGEFPASDPAASSPSARESAGSTSETSDSSTSAPSANSSIVGASSGATASASSGVTADAAAAERPLIADPSALMAASQTPESGGELALPPASVKFRGSTLFVVRDMLGPKTPEERAHAIEGRIEALTSSDAKILDRIQVQDRQLSTDVAVDDIVLFTVTEGDAAPTGRTRQQLAADYTRQLRYRLGLDFRERSLKGIARAGMYSALATLLLVVLVLLVNFVKRRASKRISSWTGTHIGALRFQKMEVLPVEQVVEIIINTLRFLQMLAIVMLGLIYLNTVLSFFPWTRAAARSMFSELYGAAGWAVGGLVGYLPNVLYISVIAFVASYGLRFLRLVFREIEKGTVTVPGFFRDWATPTYKIVRFLFLAFVVVIVFPYLPGASSPAFQGVSLFLGLLLSLGSTAAVANVVAGIVLTYMRPFSVGDRVKIADTVGDVVEKTLLVVRVRTIKNVEITIANAMVLNNHIINYSTCAEEHGLILHTTVTIGYDVPWKQVHALLIAAAQATEDVLSEPGAFVLQTSLDDFYVSYELNAYTNQPQKMARIYSELHAHIQDRFNEAGVEIMSPHYHAARDGNTMAIPEDYLPKNYRAPAFRIAPLPPAPGAVSGAVSGAGRDQPLGIGTDE